jgi:Lysine methyltransferase
MKLLHENLRGNQLPVSSSSKGRKSTSRPKRGSAPAAAPTQESNIITRALDWETDEVTASITGSQSCQSFDAVIACDCIYNDALIEPLVQTCVDACRLGSTETGDGQKPTACIVAQQLRSAEVFESWLKAFCRSFRVWRVPDEQLIDGLKSNSGFVIHIGILK